MSNQYYRYKKESNRMGERIITNSPVQNPSVSMETCEGKKELLYFDGYDTFNGKISV